MNQLFWMGASPVLVRVLVIFLSWFLVRLTVFIDIPMLWCKKNEHDPPYELISAESHY